MERFTLAHSDYKLISEVSQLPNINKIVKLCGYVKCYLLSWSVGIGGSRVGSSLYTILDPSTFSLGAKFILATILYHRLTFKANLTLS